MRCSATFCLNDELCYDPITEPVIKNIENKVSYV